MVTLLDIADVKHSVEIRGKTIEVRGILAEHLALLFHRFPEIKKVWVGKADQDSMMTIINQAPMMVAEIIAIATGAEPSQSDYQKHVDVAASLSVGEQFMLLQKIGQVTFPQGPRVFLEGVAAAVGIPPEELGWDQVTKLQQQSRAKSSQDGTNEIAGEAPRAH